MYYPYFRGKQFELIVIREQAELMKDSGIVPIIEPVRSSFGPLKKAISALRNAECPFVLIDNPQYGDMACNPQSLHNGVLNELLGGYSHCYQGHIVNESTSTSELEEMTSYCKLAFIHDGMPSGTIRDRLAANCPHHLFILDSCSASYRQHFEEQDTVLIRDGFTPRRRNRDYPDTEHFSDIHITHAIEKHVGFGDYLTIGKQYQERGGPAYAVAIHLTFFADENNMGIRHYVSDSTTSPTDPGGKFLEALNKLHSDVTSIDSPVWTTPAVSEFIDLYKKEHYPNLGYVKKLSMQHHIQLMAEFLT